jgi:response regulator RpfG family c-di-GMP phosphodiesterase
VTTRVLVVDDEPGIREVLSAWLEAAGYACDQAEGAEEALDRLHRTPADVTLVDLAMPGRDGVWLAREIRDRWSDMALIMVTGQQQRFDAAVEGMRLGVRDYLLKPFTRTELVHSVRRAAEWRESLERQRAAELELRREIAQRTEALASAFRALESASAATLAALLETLGRRDAATAAHAVRISRMAGELAAALDIAGPARTDIERGAMLHDLGKVAMPDSLIYKTGPLTEEEIAIIRTHPQVGHSILSVVPALKAAAEIVLGSHEAWDGSGYPRGLSGRAIPIGSRIVSVVDTYDALTWGRRHRDAVSRVRAAAELVRCAGGQFDPDVVNRWLRVIDVGAGGRDPFVAEAPVLS